MHWRKNLSCTDMEKKADKRSISRVPIHESISFEITERYSGTLVNILKNGLGLDISSGGIGLTTSFPVEVGSVLKLYFPITSVNASLPVYTDVKWSSPIEGGFRIGLRFLA